MAEKHPYVPSQGYLSQVLNHLRKSFPNSVSADTLKKLGFAPKNESYILNVLRFLDMIDKDGGRTESAAKIFNLHEDDKFAVEFAKIVRKSYSGLFDLHGEEAWTLNIDSLISYFRTSDESTALVGKLQAMTFGVLSGYSGYRQLREPKRLTPQKVPRSGGSPGKKETPKREKANQLVKPKAKARSKMTNANNTDFGLTVRIEINLPSDGAQEVYDRIFKSIREHFLSD